MRAGGFPESADPTPIVKSPREALVEAVRESVESVER
jgi:hypothetical protein